ncbi:hypothetical protein LSAT2_025061 [Lamellibrachia satsuma]|nr:hypothetical protein LSAT2_025061 [Lamellibrachia satsuma]
MFGRYGKAKRQFGTKPMSRCRQLSLARSVIRKREKGDSEADTSADAPVAGHSAGPVKLEAEPEQMPSSTELDVDSELEPPQPSTSAATTPISAT